MMIFDPRRRFGATALLPLLLTLLLCLFSIPDGIESFQLGPRGTNNVPLTFRSSSIRVDRGDAIRPWSSPSSSSTTELGLKKKKKTKQEEPEVKEEKRGIELVLLYMTPWRNPNSIFVYLFATVYFLGKYSEAKGGNL
mmetsp:Transcript_5375/g.13504  ORF Transcript_5375/g.13504 Transcript_5375/m.13504 type:complete len:138 (+) Transcript_5375:119-532(+)